MHDALLPPALDRYFQRLRSGVAFAWVLWALSVGLLVGGGMYIVQQSRFEAWTLVAVVPALLLGALSLRVHRRVHNPLGTPEARAIIERTLRGYYVRKDRIRAAGAHVGSLFSIVLELPGGGTAYLNPVSEEDRAALLRALAVQCPQARNTPPE